MSEPGEGAPQPLEIPFTAGSRYVDTSRPVSVTPVGEEMSYSRIPGDGREVKEAISPSSGQVGVMPPQRGAPGGVDLPRPKND